MRRFATALLLVLAVAGMAVGENVFVSVSATSTATTNRLKRSADSVLICSQGPNTAYYRLFTLQDVNADLVGNATTAYATLLSGACKSYPKPGVDKWAAYSVVTSGADTATVTLDAN